MRVLCNHFPSSHVSCATASRSYRSRFACGCCATTFQSLYGSRVTTFHRKLCNHLSTSGLRLCNYLPLTITPLRPQWHKAHGGQPHALCSHFGTCGSSRFTCRSFGCEGARGPGLSGGAAKRLDSINSPAKPLLSVLLILVPENLNRPGGFRLRDFLTRHL